MTARTPLVTGATGKAGRYTVLLPRGHGCRVLALVHRLDERSDALAAQDAEAAMGDLLDQACVRHAFDGVDAAYFCSPIETGLLEATAVFAHAACEAKVGAIVNMSQISARRAAESDDLAARLAAAGRPAHLIQYLRHVAIDTWAGRFAGHNDVVEPVGGVPGITVERFVDKHRGALAS